MKRLAILGLVSVALLAVTGGLFVLGNRSVDQPISFNHRLHVQTVGLECTDCHLYALTGTRATIPNVETCGGCHAEAATDSPEEARLVEHVASETPIPWKNIYWVPDDVYFSHRRHTALGDIECDVCHGEMRDKETPVTRRAVPIDMDDCIECHRQRGATDDCIACHR